MAFPGVKSYATLDPITSLTIPPIGSLFHPPRVNQGPSRGSWIYNFYLTGTGTPQDVYQDGALTTVFAPKGQVTGDAFGRFPAIYLDNSIAYKVTLSNSVPTVQQTRDPYNPAMATTGFAQKVSAIGLVITPQGELTMTEANAGGNAIELSVTAGLGGAMKIQGITPGLASLIADTTVTTGAQTATFAATNMPTAAFLQISVTATAAPAGGAYVGGTLTAAFTGITSTLYTIVLSTGQVILNCTFTNGSTTFTCPSTAIVGSPTATFTVSFNTGAAGWLPVQADGVLYYTPIFHASAFTPYVFKGNTYQGQVINGANDNTTYNNPPVGYTNGGPVTFNGNGTCTMYGISSFAAPPTYYTPPQAGIGANTWINITTTSNPQGNNFSAAVGAWTNITSGGLTVSLTNVSGAVGIVSGTYQLSTSAGGSPVVANGTITLAPTLHVYGAPNQFGVNGGTATETIPSGPYTNVVIEVWASGGGGSSTLAGQGRATSASGGSGSYGRSVYSIAALGGVGKTFNVTWGTSGTGGVSDGSGGNGNASTVTAGTVAGFTTISTNPGQGGVPGNPGTGGAGGTAGSGGNSANVAGNAGTAGPNNGRGLGVVGVVEPVIAAWSPGSGGNGATFADGSGIPGGVGEVLFAYI